MAVESAADLAAFFNVSEFGVEAVWTPVATGQASTPIQGIFDDAFLALTVGEHVAGADLQPQFLCRSSDVPPAAAGGDVGDLLVVSGTEHRVVELQSDGAGLTLVTLAK